MLNKREQLLCHPCYLFLLNILCNRRSLMLNLLLVTSRFVWLLISIICKINVFEFFTGRFRFYNFTKHLLLVLLTVLVTIFIVKEKKTRAWTANLLTYFCHHDKHMPDKVTSSALKIVGDNVSKNSKQTITSMGLKCSIYIC